MTTYDFFGISTEVWNAMSSEQKAALESAAAEASTYSLDIFKDLEADGKQKLADAGMEFIDIDVDSFRACMDKFYELAGLMISSLLLLPQWKPIAPISKRILSAQGNFPCAENSKRETICRNGSMDGDIEKQIFHYSPLL